MLVVKRFHGDNHLAVTRKYAGLPNFGRVLLTRMIELTVLKRNSFSAEFKSVGWDYFDINNLKPLERK